MTKAASVLLVLAGVVVLVLVFIAVPAIKNLRAPRESMFTSIRVFDGMRVLDNQTVVVQGGRFTEVYSPEKGWMRSVSSNARVIRGEGKTLLPGFIDAHVHLEFYDPKRVLKGGITTARDTGWPAVKIFPLVERLASDPGAGPFLLASGPMITARNGYPTSAGWAPAGTALQISNAEEGRQAVKRLKTQGATVIKVAQDSRQGPVLSTTVLGEVVQQAHELGLKVTSHLGTLDELEVALEAGVDELAHGLWSDEVIPDAMIRRMVDAGMTVVPTLHIDPSPQRIDNLRRFLSAGGKVIYGTDMGNSGPPPGIDVVELQLMIEAGMSPLEALASATAKAASYLRLQDRGRIAQGFVADLIMVEGNPLEDLGVLSKPVLVMRQGKTAD